MKPCQNNFSQLDVRHIMFKYQFHNQVQLPSAIFPSFLSASQSASLMDTFLILVAIGWISCFLFRCLCGSYIQIYHSSTYKCNCNPCSVSSYLLPLNFFSFSILCSITQVQEKQSYFPFDTLNSIVLLSCILLSGIIQIRSPSSDFIYHIIPWLLPRNSDLYDFIVPYCCVVFHCVYTHFNHPLICPLTPRLISYSCFYADDVL